MSNLKCFRCNQWDGERCACKDGQTIFHGDCREVLPLLPKVDLVLTDPPYGISHKSNGQVFLDASQIAGDESTELCDWCRDAVRPTPLVMFFSPYKPLSGFRNVLVWNKGEHVGIGGDRETCWKRDFELIGVENNGPLSGKRDSAVISVPALLPPPSGHFAEKPVRLIQKLIEKCGGETVLDPFLGSGTTLRACKDLGRRGIGIEISEEYCRIAAERLKQNVFSFDRPATSDSNGGHRDLF